jgi:hypothetical protein
MLYLSLAQARPQGVYNSIAFGPAWKPRGHLPEIMAPPLWPLQVLIAGVNAFYKRQADAVSGSVLK